MVFFGFFSFLFFLALLLFLTTASGSKGRDYIRERVDGLVTLKEDLADFPNLTSETNSQDALKTMTYVLGGSQNSLRLKFRTTADLYVKGMSGKILIASLPGITEYAEDVGRNLSNEEWKIRQLNHMGIEQDKIEFINLQDGYFGTMREAKTLKTISIERGIDRVVLVCSAYHSKRVSVTFSEILKDSGVEIEVFTADEKVILRGLLLEYAKLVFYENLLIPFEVWSQKKAHPTMPIKEFVESQN